MEKGMDFKTQLLFDSLRLSKKGLDYLSYKILCIENRILRPRKNNEFNTLNLDRHGELIRNKVKPVFVLSPGRSGTKTMSALMSLSPYVKPHHEPDPNLYNVAYIAFMGNDKINKIFWTNIFRTERDPLIFRSELNGMTYFETNSRMALLAPYLSDYYPQSKFIYVTRHPFKVIRSFMRRSYYKDNWFDNSRITPNESDAYYKKWTEMSLLEKCAWNWDTVNKAVINFLKNISPERHMQMRAELLFSGDIELIQKMFHFVSESPVPRSKRIRNVIKRKINVQTSGDYPQVEEWTKSQIDSVKNIVGATMEILGYE